MKFLYSFKLRACNITRISPQWFTGNISKNVSNIFSVEQLFGGSSQIAVTLVPEITNL